MKSRIANLFEKISLSSFANNILFSPFTTFYLIYSSDFVSLAAFMFFCGKHIGSLVNVPKPEVQITVIYSIRKENLHAIGPRIIGHTPMKLKNLIPLKPYIRVRPC